MSPFGLICFNYYDVANSETVPAPKIVFKSTIAALISELPAKFVKGTAIVNPLVLFLASLRPSS